MKANIGLIGLAVMGENLALNMESKGFTVAVYNRSVPGEEGVVDRFINGRGKSKRFIGTHSIEQLVDSVKSPHIIMMMVKAGRPVDELISQLLPFLSSGDVIIDGGNSDFHDTERRVKELEKKGIYFVGTGISGGEEGALHGPSVMPGGSVEAWPLVKDILQGISAKLDDGSPCCEWIGAGGAGHFVKMVHNGIEYADMQVIGEAYDILRRGLGMDAEEIGDVFAEWNKGDLDSYLIEITAEILHHKDAETGKPFVDVVVDHAGMKGTGTWTVQTGLECGSPVAAIGEAVFARALSSHGELREDAQKEGLAGPNKTIDLAGEDKAAFVEDVRKALFASKVVAYAQGLNEIQDGAKEYGWDINLSEVARIWRGGCIIRAQFLLDRITEAFKGDNPPASLLFDPYFEKIIGESQDAWRRVIVRAVEAGIPTPVFSSSLAYYDGLRSKRLPTALTQSQRDFFGAHTYGRVDKPGVFHTLWAEEGKPEIEA